MTLSIGVGVVPVPQPAESLGILQRELDYVDDFGLAAAHDLISLSGSLILAFAVMRGHLDAARAWDVSRVDEDWQISQWGADEDATAAAAVTEEPPEDLVKGLNALRDTPALVMGVASDILFPAWQQREVAAALRKAGNRRVTHVELGEDRSLFGHDTFLLDLEGVGGEIRRFLG